jgi:hypothetical protein
MLIKTVFIFFALVTSFGHPRLEAKRPVLTKLGNREVDTSKNTVVAKPILNLAIAKAVAQSDTVEMTNLSTKEAQIPVDPEKITKVVILKDVAADDYSKYIISIISLLIGFFLNRVYDWWNSNRRMKRSGERWVVEMQSIKVPIDTQIDSLNDFKAKLDLKDFVALNMVTQTAINGDVFKSLDKNELIKYIELNNGKAWYKRPFIRSKNDKSVEFKKIVRISNRTHGYIAILSHQSNMINERYNAFLAGTSKHITEFTKNLQLFIAELRKFNLSIETEGKDIGVEPITAPIVQLYIQYIVPHIIDGKYNPFLLRDDYFAPVVEHLTVHRSDSRTIPLVSAAICCLDNIAGIQMERTYMIENINTITTNYKELADSLQPMIDEIAGKKV